jgi:transcription initiation factor TFIID TATA-box-binding protein
METVSIDRYRTYLKENDIEQYNGDAAAYLDLIEDVSLNALALGLGRQDIQYDPDGFPAIRYDLNSDKTTPTQTEYCATVLLFENGLLVTADAPDTDKATDALLTVGDQFENIGVFDVQVSDKAIHTDPNQIPLPLDILNEL